MSTGYVPQTPVETTPEEWEEVYKARPSVFKAIHKAMIEHQKTNLVSCQDVAIVAQYLLADMGSPLIICTPEGQPAFKIIEGEDIVKH